MPKKQKQVKGELIYGIHPLIELLKAKRRKVISIYTTRPEPAGWQQIAKYLPKYPVPIQYVDRKVLHRMADTTDHQSVVAWVQSYPFRKKFFDPKKQSFLVMLDGIQDPRNLGAILRSAYCTGADGVVLPKKNTASLTAATLKASAGLAEHLQIFVASSTTAAVQELKKAGYTLYLATFEGQNATTYSYEQPLCLVVGGEATGISKNILQLGTQITLPQRTTGISYNASVAAGILLFLIGAQIQKV